MADTFQINIATPEKLILETRAESAQIPGKDGYMGILRGHAALLSELGAGTLSVTSGGQTRSFTIAGGYVEVRDNHVRVLADRVEQG
jgi:F-type H+-transporting ATPase subunit epsilon